MKTTIEHRKRRLGAVVVLTLLITPSARAQSGYAVDWHTVDGGGAGPSNASTGGTYALSGTIGQPDARNHPRAMTGGSYKLTGGFWVIPECPAIPADYDNDCDVDQADYQAFQTCASGPGCAYANDCDNRDFDGDNDVDQADFATFQRCVSGEGQAAAPQCAD
jgi:hypothetical protein